MAADYNETINLDSDDFDFGEYNPPEGEKKNKTIWIIVAVIAVLVLCCCLVFIWGGVWLWNNGDQLIEDFSLLNQFLIYFVA